MYLPRLIEKTLHKVRRSFPAIVITGPRQSGKSTLLKNVLSQNRGTYVVLEDPNLRAMILENPKGYLNKIKKPVILDEIQELPEVLPFIKRLIDDDRRPGQWFMTGSQNFVMMKNVSESLAGRAAILTLPPFQIQERSDIKNLHDFMWRGSYPELIVNKKVSPGIWYSSYLQTYLERDVRKIINVQDLRDFEQLLKMLATRTGQELHYSKLSSDLGISVPTVKRWISVLETSYIIFLLPPYFENYGKRLIRAPKIYFFDIGLLNYLLGIHSKEQVLTNPMAGFVFETAVVSEILKKKYSLGVKPDLYYWRSQNGIEIDLLVSEEGSYHPYEIKLSSTLITNCKESMPLPEQITNIHWEDL